MFLFVWTIAMLYPFYTGIFFYTHNLKCILGQLFCKQKVREVHLTHRRTKILLHFNKFRVREHIQEIWIFQSNENLISVIMHNN